MSIFNMRKNYNIKKLFILLTVVFFISLTFSLLRLYYSNMIISDSIIEKVKSIEWTNKESLEKIGYIISPDSQETTYSKDVNGESILISVNSNTNPDLNSYSRDKFGVQYSKQQYLNQNILSSGNKDKLNVNVIYSFYIEETSTEIKIFTQLKSKDSQILENTLSIHPENKSK